MAMDAEQLRAIINSTDTTEAQKDKARALLNAGVSNQISVVDQALIRLWSDWAIKCRKWIADGDTSKRTREILERSEQLLAENESKRGM